MYAKKLQSILRKKKISTGERIAVEKENRKYEGLLMPRIELGDQESLVLKLDNGYNIGIRFGPGVKIEKSRTHEPEEVKEEEEYELGKTKKRYLEVSFDPKKPPVCLVTTGGTISSRVDYRTGGVYAVSNPKELLHNVPELAEIVNIREMVTPFTKMSEDMDCFDWRKIAEIAAKKLNSGDQGVVIGHGTDTLHFTAAALSFFLRNLSKPVVLVGSQRSSDRGSSDAGMNLICAARVAVSDIAEVGICMHGEPDDSYCLFLRGTKVRKMHTSRRDAFRPVNDLPLAKVWPDGRLDKINPEQKRRSEGKVELDIKFEPDIAILKAYPGSDPGVIDYYVRKGYKGFVIEGTGLGHVPTFAKKSWISVIKKHSEQIPFVVAPQALYGRVNTDVYTNLRILYHEAKAIPGEDMLPETAYVKLGWVLGHTKNMEKVREMMLTNYAGEITPRSLPETYLY
ncbi:MAG: Glu-tRNA(Gln) amidotransferase subunit GatD [Candidatus Aenigmarchaeota archaeon]|nr:Glu-tRNA(Gln) amidotransferase subunit GatD [Candidatus Aenigmarchaeota archaeon]